MRRYFSTKKAKQIKRVAVELIMTKPLDIYDLRKMMFAKMISINKEIPFVCYSHTSGVENQSIVRRNREIMKEFMEVQFEKEVVLDGKDSLERADGLVDSLKQVQWVHVERKSKRKG